MKEACLLAFYIYLHSSSIKQKKILCLDLPDGADVVDYITLTSLKEGGGAGLKPGQNLGTEAKHF